MDKDEQTTFIDSQGKLNPKAVKWSEVKLPKGRILKVMITWLAILIFLKAPLITVHDQPYLISVLSKSIEIRTDEPSVLIQVSARSHRLLVNLTFLIVSSDS